MHQFFLKENNNDTDFVLLKEARRGRTLVLAAHPDDEVLGCGGAIISHIRQGDPVFIVIATDGGFPVHPDQQVPGYALLRKRESMDASQVLGCGTPRFLDYTDQRLNSVKNLADKLLQLYNEYQPEIIYLPAFTEIHPDHYTLYEAGTEAATKFTGDFTLFYYETGAPTRPNCYLDITESIGQKRHAIQCFVSQLKVQNLEEQITGLNQYRAYYLPKEIKCAEAFYIIEKQKLNQLQLQPYKVNSSLHDSVSEEIKLMHWPMISVIIRTMGLPLLKEALASVFTQHYPNLEIILVDARGNFDVSKIALPENINLKLISEHRHLSRPAAANAGLEAVGGDYFCFLDEDDLIESNHISDLWKWLHFRDEPAAYCGIRMVDENGSETAVYNEPFSLNRLISENFIPIHAVLYKRKVLDEGCRFDERLSVFEDWDFLLSVLQSGVFFHLDKISGTYRNFRSSGLYWDPEISQRDRNYILEKWRAIHGNPILNNPIAGYFYKNRRNIVHKWPHYFEIYHKYFQRFINTECTVVEIGVSLGGSLQMWRSYFGKRARIIGIDINPECRQFGEPGIEIFIGSQSDPDFLRQFLEIVPRIDILIDDGGHRMDEQIISFENLFPNISNHGVYLCEDTHTSYLEIYGGGLGNPASFIEYAKTLADHLHAWHMPDHVLPASDYTRNIQAVSFYDSIVVIEKRARVQPWSEVRGAGLLPEAEPLTPISLEISRMKLKLLGAGLPDYCDVGGLISHPGHLKSYLGDKYEGTIWPDQGETMIGWKRLTHLEMCIKNIIEENIPGDFIETGVWRGGACIFMAYLLKINKINNRIVWIADSFQGLPAPDPQRYPLDSESTLHTVPCLAVSEAEVRKNFEKYVIEDSNTRFLKGWFKDTLPTAPIERLSLLRLDGDLYESTMDALQALYHRLAPGGYCIIDDYGAIPACRQAVEDFRQTAGIAGEIIPIDWTGVYWRKQ